MFGDVTTILSNLLGPTFFAAVLSSIFLWWKTRRDELAQKRRDELDNDKNHEDLALERDRLRLDAMGETNNRLTAENVRMNGEIISLRGEVDGLRNVTIPNLYKRIEELEQTERELVKRLARYENG